MEREIFGEISAINIVKGKLCNPVVRAHKLRYEAILRVLWPMFLTWAQENGRGKGNAEETKELKGLKGMWSSEHRGLVLGTDPLG